jgi:hypothetical protein
LKLSLNHYFGGMHIGHGLPVRMAFGMAHIMAELQRFPANIALQFTSLLDNSEFLLYDAADIWYHNAPGLARRTATRKDGDTWAK